MDITSKMCDFLLVIFSLIKASAAEMPLATTTREFRRCFHQSWVNADQVKVSCNATQIAQYCDPDQSCANMSKPGVSLEKGKVEVCLTITNCSYDSWSCEAQSYISDKEHKDNFTVNVCNQPTSTSPSPGNSGSNVAVWGPILGLIILGLIILGLIILGLIILRLIILRLIIFGLIIYFYKMRAPEEEQDIELEEARVMIKKNLLRENNMKEVFSATSTLM